MRGYKALLQDMTAIKGNGMKYELGKSYFIEGEVIPCRKGFHFCKNIEDLENYYRICESRIFEVEADGDMKTDDNKKYCASKIRLLKEIGKEEIKKYFEENADKFVNSRYACIRRATADQGYGLDVLIKDENIYVKTAVAKQGYGLDILIKDKAWFVRQIVAEQGYGVDVLIKDEDWDVRAAAKKYMEMHPE